MAQIAHAGPSRRKPDRNSEVIDLTLSDDDRSSIILVTMDEHRRQEAIAKQRKLEPQSYEGNKVDRNKQMERPRTSGPANVEHKVDDRTKVNKGKQVDRGRAPGDADMRQRGDEMRKGNKGRAVLGNIGQRLDEGRKVDKGKQVDRGTTSIIHRDRSRTAEASPRHDNAQDQPRPDTGSNMRRKLTTAHPTHGLPSVHDKLMARNTSSSAVPIPLSNKKVGRQRDLQRSISPQKPARPIAGSSRVASHKNNGLARRTSDTGSFFRSSSVHPPAISQASGSGAPINHAPAIYSPTDPYHRSKHASGSNDVTSRTQDGRGISQGSSFVAPSGSGRSVSPIKGPNPVEGRGLVPGPREREKGKERQQVDHEPRDRTERPAGGDRGIKRGRDAAFGSTGKPDSKPGAKVGRQRDLSSSAEVSRMMSPGKILADTSGQRLSTNRPLQRSDSRTDSNGKATPTPTARPLPTAGRSTVLSRRENLLMESTSSRNLASRQPGSAQQPKAEPLASPPRQSVSPAKPRPSTGKKPTTSSFGIFGLRTETSSNNRRRSTLSPDKNTRDAPVVATPKDPPYKSHRSNNQRHEEEEEDVEEEDDDAEKYVVSRPKRARPAPGAYTVPGMDDPNWPTRNGTSGNESGARGRQRKLAAFKAKAEANGQSSTQIAKPSKVDNGDARSIISFHSTEVSESPDKRDPHHNSSSRKHIRPSKTDSSSGLNFANSTAGPSKVPSTPQPRHQRLSSQTPRTLSKQSLKSHHSLKSNASPHKASSRRVRPATLTPKTPYDGPEEEEEPVENRPPTPAKTSQSQPAEDDVLAMFAGYDFPVSPEQSKSGLKDGTPKTPRSNVEPSTPQSTATKPIPAPGSGRSILAETADLNAPPSARRLLEFMRSPLHGLSPKRIRNIGNAGSRNLVADILANAEAENAKRAEREAEREKRKRRLAAIIEDTSTVELQDISATDMLIPSQELPTPEEEEEDTQEDSIASRRAANVRTASLPKPKNKPKPSPAKVEPRKAKAAPTEAELFLKRHERAKPGERVGDADVILQAISRSMSPQKPGVSATDSNLGSEDGDTSGISKDLRLDLLEDNEEIGELLQLAKQVRGSTRETAVVECEVFWSKEPVKSSQRLDAPTAHGDLVDLCANVPAGLLSIVLPALRSSIKPKKSLVVDAITEVDPAVRSVLLAQLSHTMTVAPSDLFGIVPGFFHSTCSIWATLGARSQLFPTNGMRTIPRPIALDREEASSLICRMIRVMLAHQIKRGAVDIGCFRKFIPLLLLLVVDPETSPALRRTIDDTLTAIWAESAFVYDNIPRRESFITDGAGFIALAILRQTDTLPIPIRSQVLMAIGHATSESQSVSRWYAAGLLLPGSIKGLDQVTDQQTPNIDLIIEGAERILDITNSPKPQFELINNLITCLYATLSDVETLVLVTPYDPSDTEDNHPILDLRALLMKIHHKIKAPGDDHSMMQVSHMKARLAQLATVLEMQFQTAFRRMKRDKAKMKLSKGKGLKEGKDGQAMLAFERDVTLSASAERGP